MNNTQNHPTWTEMKSAAGMPSQEKSRTLSAACINVAGQVAGHVAGPMARAPGGVLRLLTSVFVVAALLSLIHHPLLAHAQGEDGELQQLEVDSSIEKVVHAVAGDTFASLAYREFGSVGMARLLAEYNHLAFATQFKAGQEIIIPTHIEQKPNFAKVVYVKGTANVHVAGSNLTVRELAVDDQIYTTDVVVTGISGFLSVTLSNGSVLNIQPDSRVSLDQLDCLSDDIFCTFNMRAETGAVSADVRRREGQTNRFLIETPYASAAVRGTIFDFEADEEAIVVGVTEGEVLISANSSELNLPVGYGTKAIVGQTPGNAIALLERPRFMSAPQRISSEDVVAWRKVEGARSYLVSVSRDEAGTSEIYRENLDNMIHQVRQLPVGTVYARVRSLDENRIRGFTGTRELEIVEIDKSLAIPALDIEQENLVAYVSVADKQSELLHELQFSTSRDFRELVTVDVPSDGGALHQLEGDQRYFVRGRAVANDQTVGPYSGVIEIEPN